MPKGTPEIFYRTVQFWEDVNPPPVFDCDGIHFLHIKRNRLFFVFSTKNNVSTTFYLELLSKIANVLTEYIGNLTEGGIRKNATLIYELMNEIMDSGYVESTSAEFLHDFIYTKAENNQMQFVNKLSMMVGQDLDVLTMVDAITNKSDLFVNVVENFQCIMNSSRIQTSSIEGKIIMKNQLIGRPRFHVTMNRNIVIGRDVNADDKSSVYLDDTNFHPSVDVTAFEDEHILHLTGPEGTFTAMNYRSTRPVLPPILIEPIVEHPSEYKLDIVIKISTSFSTQLVCKDLFISFHTPLTTSSCKCELPAEAKKQGVEYSDTKRLVMWRIAEAPGHTDHFLHVIITLTKPCGPYTIKSMGPIALNFNIPNMSLSSLEVKDIEIDSLTNDDMELEPNRWVNYLVKSSSYICRF